jgi:hypothetical protein
MPHRAFALFYAVLAVSFLLRQHALAEPETITDGPRQTRTNDSTKAQALLNAKTAALVVRATSTVSCPEGAPGDCIRTDGDIVSEVNGLVENTNLWAYFEKANPTRADIILYFKVEDNAIVRFSVRDSDTNTLLYSEDRQVVSLDNDVNRIVAHFVSGLPTRTAAEQQAFAKKKECAEILAQYDVEWTPYDEKLKDYSWKMAHEADGIMNECEQHWKDYVCLDASAASQTHAHSAYADNWNQSIVEFARKLKLEHDWLSETKSKLDEMMKTAKTNSCFFSYSE